MRRINLIKLFNPNLPKTNEEFQRVKFEFLLNDIKHKDILYQGGKPDINLDDFEINYEFVSGSSKSMFKDELGFEEELVDLEYDVMTIDFEEEFKKALQIGLDRFCSKFISNIHEKAIYTEDTLEGYKRERLKIINKLIGNYQTKSDLPDGYKNLIVEFFKKFYDYISVFSFEEVQISDKLKFKLSKNQVILLFQVMLNKSIISGISELDLYRILDEKVMYIKKGVYINMKNTRRQANKLQNGHTSEAVSLVELSKIFDKNFFSTTL
jgi:hypothetical protein